MCFVGEKAMNDVVLLSKDVMMYGFLNQIDIMSPPARKS